MSAARPNAGRRLSPVWLQGLLCGALLSCLPGIGFAALVLAAPAILAVAADARPAAVPSPAAISARLLHLLAGIVAVIEI